MRLRLIVFGCVVVAGVVSAVVLSGGGGEPAEPVAVVEQAAEVAEEPPEVVEGPPEAAEDEAEVEAEEAEVEEAESAPEPAEEERVEDEQAAEQPDASAEQVDEPVADAAEEPPEVAEDEEPAATEPAEEGEPEVAPAIVAIPLSAPGPPVPVVGPLLVFSGPVPVGVARTRREPGQATRRVSLYDMETDQYWDAFDYSPRRQWNHHYKRWDYSYEKGRLGVQVAGTQLILWSMDQIVRVTLTGQIETVLFEDADIRAFEVSPAGAHVAILYGLSGTLIVLDAATGAERLRVANNAPVIKALRGPSGGILSLGHWQVDGTALTLTIGTRKLVSPPPDSDASESPPPIEALVDGQRTAIIGLDGTTRVLPDDWWPLSPDLRYAIRRGFVIKAGTYSYSPGMIWDRWDVVDVETGALRWTIADANGIREPFLPGYGAYWLGDSQAVAFHIPYKGDRILDIGTGEVRPVTIHALQTLARGNCRRGAARRIAGTAFPHPCDLWETYHGRIEAPEGGKLPGPRAPDLQPIVSAPVLPSPPARTTIVGPLFLYEIAGPHEAVVDETGDIWHDPTRRVVAYDEGTGRRWLVFRYRSPTVQGQRGLVQLAPDGFVVSTDQGLRYVSVDGQTTPLEGGGIEWHRSLRQRLDPWDYQVSPDGQKVVVSFDDQIAVFDLPSGDALLRVPEDDLVALWEEQGPRSGRERHGACMWDLYQVLYRGEPILRGIPTCYYVNLNRDEHYSTPLAWGPDSETILIEFWEESGGSVVPVGAGTITLDGVITILDGHAHPDVWTPFWARRGRTACRDAPAFPCRILLDDRVVGQGRWPTIIGVVDLD